MNKKSTIYVYLFFLISPIAGVVFAFKNLKQRFSYNLIWFFIVFFGLTFTVVYDSESDIVRYLEEFNTWKFPDRNFLYLIQNVFTTDGYKDLFFPFISLVAAKSGLSDILFLGLLGLIFGYYYTRTFKMVVDEVNVRFNWMLIILLAAFLLIDPPWRGINGFRFSLAAIIYVYCVFKIYKNDKRFFYKIFLSSLFLVHFSMVFPILLFHLFYFIKGGLNIKVLFIIYILSFFFNSMNLDSVNEVLKNYVPDFLLDKVDGYARESYVDEIEEAIENTNFYAVIFLKLLFYACSFMIAHIYYSYKDLLKLNPKLEWLIKFTFFISIIVNVTTFIPSFSRMGLISNMLTFYVFIYLFVNLRQSKLQLISMKIIITPLLLFYFIVQMRIGFDFLSVETLLGNPFVAAFGFDKTALIELIK